MGEEVTADGMAAYFESIKPLVNYVMYSGQRYADPKKLTKNEPSTVTQRVYVLTHMLKPAIFGFKKNVEVARELNVSKSLIMRAVKDFNVAFGIYAPNQKKVSSHATHLGGEDGGGTYVAASKASWQRRREKAAAAAALTNTEL